MLEHCVILKLFMNYKFMVFVFKLTSFQNYFRMLKHKSEDFRLGEDLLI